MPDILIRGMEMPEGNDILVFDVWHGKMYARSTANTGTRRYEVVPLPEGHGDLIDRDAFRAENGLNAKCEHCPTNTYECQRDMIHTKMDFCGMLDDAPVIVPAEGGADDGT